VISNNVSDIARKARRKGGGLLGPLKLEKGLAERVGLAERGGSPGATGYSESSTAMENIIVETIREFITQNRDKVEKTSAAGPLARSVRNVLTLIWRCFTIKYQNFCSSCAIYHKILYCYFSVEQRQNNKNFDIL
jgi:hypothetical protein